MRLPWRKEPAGQTSQPGSADAPDHRKDSCPIWPIYPIRTLPDRERLGKMAQSYLNFISFGKGRMATTIIFCFVVPCSLFAAFLVLAFLSRARDRGMLLALSLLPLGVLAMSYFGIWRNWPSTLYRKQMRRSLERLRSGQYEILRDRVEEISFDPQKRRRVSVRFRSAGRYMVDRRIANAENLYKLEKKLPGDALLFTFGSDCMPVLFYFGQDDVWERVDRGEIIERGIDKLAREQFGGDVEETIRWAIGHYEVGPLEHLFGELDSAKEVAIAHRLLVAEYDEKYPGGWAAMRLENALQKRYGITRQEAREPIEFPYWKQVLTALLSVAIFCVWLTDPAGVFRGPFLDGILYALLATAATTVPVALISSILYWRDLRKKEIFTTEQYRQQMAAIPKAELLRLEEIADAIRMESGTQLPWMQR